MACISIGSLPCRKKSLMTARVSMVLKSRASLTCFRACFLPGRAKDLSAPSQFGFVLKMSRRGNLTYYLKIGGNITEYLTYRWPCIVINSYNKNQLDALIPQIYFWNKTIHVSDTSSVHHQEFAESYLSANLYDLHLCCVYSAKLLIMDRGTVWNTYIFIPKIDLRN